MTRRKKKKVYQDPSLQRQKRELISTHLAYLEAKTASLGVKNAQIRKIKSGFGVYTRKALKST